MGVSREDFQKGIRLDSKGKVVEEGGILFKISDNELTIETPNEVIIQLTTQQADVLSLLIHFYSLGQRQPP